MGDMLPYTPLAIAADALDELRVHDDAGRAVVPYRAGPESEPLRCCLRPMRENDHVALVSYAPLRRWAAVAGAQPGAYDEVGPVFIHADACGGPHAADAGGYPFTRPGALRVVRRYDTGGRILGGRLIVLPDDHGRGLTEALTEAFADPATALAHVRAAEYGCFHFEVRPRRRLADAPRTGPLQTRQDRRAPAVV